VLLPDIIHFKHIFIFK